MLHLDIPALPERLVGEFHDVLRLDSFALQQISFPR
jgi:hypothetical protein